MTTPSPLLATLDELDARSKASYGALGGSSWEHRRDEDAFRASLAANYPRLRAIIAAADAMREEIDDYLHDCTHLEELVPSLTAYDAARAGDGEKTT